MDTPSQAVSPAADPGDEAWVEQAKNGDERAFQMLVQRYYKQAYGLALRIVRSPSDAEEVAQDAFVRAWRALPRFRGEARFSTWLYQIVSRRAIDHSHKLRVRGEREIQLEEMTNIQATTAESPETSRIDSERLAAQLLDSLTDVQRAVVSLYYLEDRSVDQVAQSLDLPTGTVKTHLFRARRRLRTALEHEQG